MFSLKPDFTLDCNTKSKPIIDLDNELEIIKKQIEKKELLNKLDLLEKK